MIDRHLIDFKTLRIADPVIDQGFDLFKLRRFHRPRTVKVEAQPLEIDQGASLADACIHNLFQCRLEQVGGRVIRLSATAAGSVDLTMH